MFDQPLFSIPGLLYTSIVSGLCLFVILYTRYLTKTAEKRSIRRLKKQGVLLYDTGVPEYLHSADDEITQKEFVRTAIESSKARYRFIRRLAFPLTSVFWVALLVLPFLNHVPAAYLSLILGTTTVLVGIAARPFVENIISGIVIAFGQPVRIGDTVMIDGHYGTVESFSPTFTTIRIWDWRRYVVPNTKFIQKEFINYSLQDQYQWAFVEFYVNPGSDLKLVEQLARQAVLASSAHMSGEEPGFWVMGMDKDAIRCGTAGWTETPPDGWALTHQTRMKLVELFKDHNISFHMQMHQLRKDNASPLID